MRCAWKELLGILPDTVRQEADRYYRDTLQEVRLRLGKPAELITTNGCCWLSNAVTSEDLQFTVNMASRYSPWAAATVSKGYITAPGGHRIGLCGEAIVKDGRVHAVKNVTSLNIRIARDFSGIAHKIAFSGNLLIIGPPGSGKTTLLRDLARQIARQKTVSVVDERGELFPMGFETGRMMDIMTGCGKPEGIEMALRTMGPEVIVVDEITAEADCRALLNAGWCGVGLLATAHASSSVDLRTREIYRPLMEMRVFDNLLVMLRDKSFRLERMV